MINSQEKSIYFKKLLKQSNIILSLLPTRNLV